MYENVIELTGPEKGPTNMIAVGVHGNERCGIDAINELLPTLKIARGRVLIAYGNPRAIEQGMRYVEENLNRLFKSDEILSEKEKSSYEYSRAQFLKKYLNQADYLLDIHASLTPNSQRFIICEENAQNIAKYLPVPLAVSGFDTVEPGGTDYYMNQQGKTGVCIECGYLDDPSSKDVAKESIIAFLTACGNITGTSKVYPQSSIEVKGLYLTKNNFAPSKKFKDFEEANLNQIIGTDGKEKIKMPINGVVLFVRKRECPNEEAFLYGQYKNKV